jgi:hypothetical protein
MELLEPQVQLVLLEQLVKMVQQVLLALLEPQVLQD